MHGQTLALVNFALPGGSFAVFLLYLAADIFHGALAALTDILVDGLSALTNIRIDFLASVAELPGKLICTGTGFCRGGFGRYVAEEENSGRLRRWNI